VYGIITKLTMNSGLDFCFGFAYLQLVVAHLEAHGLQTLK